MKQNILLTCAALAAVCIITAFLLSVSDMTSSAPAPNAQEAGETVQGVERTPNQDEAADCQYYLRDYQGKLAVFLPDKQTPEIVFDVYLSTLPAYDRGQLQLGVPVQDSEELVKRIEDYIS